MVYQCIIDIGKSGVVPQCSKFVTISWPNLQKNILLNTNRHLVKLANSKCTALPENYHRQPHSSFYSTGSSSKSPLGLSDPLEACICLQRWACEDLLVQPFLHLEEFCFKGYYEASPFDSKPASYSAKVLWKNSIKQRCHKMNRYYYFKL